MTKLETFDNSLGIFSFFHRPFILAAEEKKIAYVSNLLAYSLCCAFMLQYCTFSIAISRGLPCSPSCYFNRWLKILATSRSWPFRQISYYSCVWESLMKRMIIGLNICCSREVLALDLQTFVPHGIIVVNLYTQYRSKVLSTRCLPKALSIPNIHLTRIVFTHLLVTL